MNNYLLKTIMLSSYPFRMTNLALFQDG